MEFCGKQAPAEPPNVRSSGRAVDNERRGVFLVLLMHGTAESAAFCCPKADVREGLKWVQDRWFPTPVSQRQLSSSASEVLGRFNQKDH